MHSFTYRRPIRTAVLAMVLAMVLVATLLAGLPGVALAQAASADAAAQQALSRLGGNGKVLSVREKTDGEGKSWFEVKVISDGNVRVFNIPRS